MLLALIGLSVNAQISATYPNGYYFIQGVPTVTDTVKITGDPYGSDSAIIYITGPNYYPIYQVSTGTNTIIGNGFYVDMDILPDTSTYFMIEYWVAGNPNYLPPSGDIPFTIITTPQWIQSPFNGTATVQNINGNILTISASIGIAPNFSSTVPPMKGIGGKSFQLLNKTIGFNITYNMQNNNASATIPLFSTDLNSLGKNKNGNSSTLSNSIIFDSNFNLTFIGNATYTMPAFNFDIPISTIPLIGPICLSTNFAMNFYPKFKAKVVLGLNGGQWGFPAVGNDSTEVLGKVNFSASLQGKIQAVCGFSFIPPIARGNITAHAMVGGGLTYNSFRTPSVTPITAGEFYITGYVTALGGLYEKSGILYKPSTSPWGSYSSFNYKTVASYDDSFFKSSATTFQASTNVTPDAWCMQSMSARDSLLSITWIDDINFTPGKYLLNTYYNPLTNGFTTPKIIAANDSMIQTPSVALLPTKRSLITWSQSTVDESLIDTSVSGGMSMDDVIKTHNIWFSICDTNQIYGRWELLNNAGGESEPKVHWGPSTKGLITWEVSDTINGGNDIYFTEVTENGINYSFTTPVSLVNGLQGYNYNLQISYYSQTDAMAEWINDPYMDGSSSKQVMYSEWYGGPSWSAPQLAFPSIPALPLDYYVKEITLSSSGIYGVDGFTYEYYTADSTLVNGVYGGTWNNSNPSAPYTPFMAPEDSTSITYQMPRAAMSKTGVASLTVQTRNPHDPYDYGQQYLFLNDLNYATGWQNASSSPYVASDTTEFIWDLSSTFGYLQSASTDDILYLFSQEMDTAHQTQPTFGKIFPPANLNLVLRALKVTSNNGIFTIDTVSVPNVTAIADFYGTKADYDFELKQNFPNPFSSQTTIPFHVTDKGIVKLEIYDMTGRLIATFINKELFHGDYQTEFNSGNLESGIYYYKMTVNNLSITKKMIIIK